jgi:O-antigen/teichoic acid export membrane protein
MSAPPSSRSHRVLGGLSIGYTSLLLNMLVGLWLTPFLIGSLGSHTYGLWLVTLQLLGYLALLDVGLLALVPRETAAAAGTRVPGMVGVVVGELRTLIRWQAPLIALGGIVLLACLPAQWQELRGPFALTLAAYVLFFPLRSYAGVLQGLQDLKFAGQWQLAAWSVGTVVLVTAAYGGAGLLAPVVGWIAHQALFAAGCRVRVRGQFAEVVATAAPRPTWPMVRRYFGRGLWVSVAQVAQILTSGTDMLLVARFVSPMAAVIYSCTAKLTAVLVNPPQMVLQLSQPAMSEVAGQQDARRFLAVFGAVSQAVLIASGGLALLVWAANETFVTWWVGEAQFGGPAVTAALVIAFTLRHVAVSLNYAAFCLGGERRLSLTVVSEGVVAVVLGFVLVNTIGMAGAAIGAALAAILINIPMNAITVASRLGVPVRRVLASHGAWVRQLALALAVLGTCTLLAPEWPEHPILRVTVALPVYAAAMVPLLFRDPLAPYVPSLLSYFGLSRHTVARPATGAVADAASHERVF